MVANVNNSSASVYQQINEANRASSTNKTDSSTSESSDMFMQLLIAQLQNQDPTQPTDTSEYVNQMATMTQVENSLNMTSAIEDLTAAMRSSQNALQASSMVGQDVFVESDSTRLDESGVIDGAYVLDQSASDVRYKVYDSSGSLLQTVNLGAQAAGTQTFSWNGAGYQQGDYTFVLEANTGNGYEEIGGYLPQNVNSVTLGTGGSDMMLNTDKGRYTLSDVIQIG